MCIVDMRTFKFRFPVLFYQLSDLLSDVVSTVLLFPGNRTFWLSCSVTLYLLHITEFDPLKNSTNNGFCAVVCSAGLWAVDGS